MQDLGSPGEMAYCVDSDARRMEGKGKGQKLIQNRQ